MKLLSTCCLSILFILPTYILAQQESKDYSSLQTYAQFLGETKPLRELAPVAATSLIKRAETKSNKPTYYPQNFLGYNGSQRINEDALPTGDDPVRQRTLTGTKVILPDVVVDGITQSETGGVGVPDVNGDKGPDHYIQIVNASWIQIFGNDGTELTAPFSANVVWSEISSASFSDPVIQYDELADRWLLTDLANINEVLYAVSTSGDPLGTYYAYKLVTPGFADYPKYGIVPNAYFFTINEGQGTEPIYALNRSQMLAGEETIDVQRIDVPGLSGKFPTLTPVDWNGALTPSGDEFYTVRLNDDAWGNGNAVDLIELWQIDLDWDDATNTTSTLIEVPTEAYDADICGSGQQTCIPQPDPQLLDAIATIIMNKSVYRNFDTHESIVLSFTVKADERAGVRWMELRRTPGNVWSVYQEGTLAPDDDELYRWMGAISINENGDIGLAYAISGTDYFPSLRFTGRSADDPLGEMTVQEYEFASGAGSMTSSNRYGDYFSMSVDPITNAFWFTGEYVKSENDWWTSVMSFALQKDTNDLSFVRLDSPVNASDLGANEEVTFTIKNVGFTPKSNFKLGYFFENNVAIVEDALIDTLKPDSAYTHTFTTTEDLSDLGSYDFKLFIEHTETDDNIRNDTALRTVMNIPHLDLSLVEFDEAPTQVCDSVVHLQLVCTNFGTDTIHNIEFTYFLNSGAAQTISWTSDIFFQEQVTIPITIGNLREGENDLTIITKTLNGQLDEIADNDTLSTNFDVLLEGEAVTFELVTDYFSNETTWELIQNGEVIYSGGPYTTPFQLYSEEWCLNSDSCYTFVIYDSYNDGVEGFYQDGNYQITNALGDVLANLRQVDFGSSESSYFCLNECTLFAEFVVNDESATGALDGAMFIDVTAGVAPFSFSIDSRMNFQASPLFENLTANVYDIVVVGANGCEFRTEVQVNGPSATADQRVFQNVVVSPNPSHDGVFYLDVFGLDEVTSPLQVRVLDAKWTSREFFKNPEN